MALKWKTISQRNWLKGLQATFSRFSQPQAAVVRLSNLLYDIRGGFRQSDGSQIITQLYGGTPNGGPILEVALYSPSGVDPYYVGLEKGNANTNQLGQPVLNPLTFSTVTGGTLVPGTTYTYYVTACDGQGGEGTNLLPATGSPTGAQNAAVISWTAVPGAVGYNVYGRIAGSIGQLNQSGAAYLGLVKGTTYTDSGGTIYPNTPPTSNTSQSVQAYLMATPTYNQILGVFPSYVSPPLGYIPGATHPPMNSPHGATANGGIAGLTGPLPQIVQFVNKLAFALGNGYPPQEYLDISSGGTGQAKPIANNYSGQYTDWQASVAWAAGDIIHDSVSGGLFKAQVGGTSGATRPVFNNTLNAVTPESSSGTVTWICIATSSSGTPLRGAAHAIVYAGSLWIANTSPTTTTDQLDGPCCIKMSDVNNLESWNPANIAFLDRDDGDEITGLAKYTIAEIGIAPTGSLVVFKNFSTYQITGVFGAQDFTIQNAQTDMGAVAGRSITFLPGFGIVRLTHLGFAYFQGVADKLISEEIRPYIFGGQPDISPVDWNYVYLSKGAQAANPPLYICACPVVQPVLQGVTVTGNATTPPQFPLYVRVEQITNGVPVAVSQEFLIQYNGVPGFTVTTPLQPGSTYRVFAGSVSGGESAYIEQATFFNQFVPISSLTLGFMSLGVGGLTRIFVYDLVIKQWAIVDLPFNISCLKQIRSPGTIPITVAGDANNGNLRRLFGGDLTWEDGSQVQWSFRASELFQEGGSAKMFFRRLVLRGTNALNSNLVVTVSLQGTDRVMARGSGGRTLLGGPAAAQQWEMRVDIMRDAENANAQISGSGPVQIQIESLDWHVFPKPSGTPVSIQKP